MIHVLDNKTVLVTGGTGSFGRKFIETMLKKFNPKRLIVFSRDELKQSDMQAQINDERVSFFIGDVRDRDRLYRAFQADVDVVVHAAALKQVPACEYNPFEADCDNEHFQLGEGTIWAGRNLYDLLYGEAHTPWEWQPKLQAIAHEIGQIDCGLIEMALDAVKSFRDKTLVIKLHPSEPLGKYRSLMERFDGHNAIVVQDVDLYSLLRASDVVMVAHTTVGVEALLCGRPVVYLNHERLGPTRYVLADAAPMADNSETLKEALHTLLFDEQRKAQYQAAREEFIQQSYHVLDGKAGERVAQKLLDLMESPVKASRAAI